MLYIFCISLLPFSILLIFIIRYEKVKFADWAFTFDHQPLINAVLMELVEAREHS